MIFKSFLFCFRTCLQILYIKERQTCLPILKVVSLGNISFLFWCTLTFLLCMHINSFKPWSDNSFPFVYIYYAVFQRQHISWTDRSSTWLDYHLSLTWLMERWKNSKVDLLPLSSSFSKSFLSFSDQPQIYVRRLSRHRRITHIDSFSAVVEFIKKLNVLPVCLPFFLPLCYHRFFEFLSTSLLYFWKSADVPGFDFGDSLGISLYIFSY